MVSGTAVIDASPGSGGSASLHSVAVASDPVTQFSALLFDMKSGPGDATAGWIISQNETAQTLTFWTNNTVGLVPHCYTTSVQLPDAFSPGFSMCPGAADSLFPDYSSSFAVGNVTMNSFVQSISGATGQFTDAEFGCGLATVFSPMSPIGSSFMISVSAGSASVPTAWSRPPSFCQ